MPFPKNFPQPTTPPPPLSKPVAISTALSCSSLPGAEVAPNLAQYVGRSFTPRARRTELIFDGIAPPRAMSKKAQASRTRWHQNPAPSLHRRHRRRLTPTHPTPPQLPNLDNNISSDTPPNQQHPSAPRTTTSDRNSSFANSPTCPDPRRVRSSARPLVVTEHRCSVLGRWIPHTRMRPAATIYQKMAM